MQKAIIDLSKNGIIPVFHAKQGDTSRRVAITLLDNGLPYDTAADAVSVWYRGPSGAGNYSDGIDKDGSTLTILVNPNMTAASGRHTCAVMLSNESGRCTTWNFCVDVAYTPALGSEEAKAYFEAFKAGELAADIAAVDARTAKAVAELNARVSAIIASGTATEGNTELIDIRTGADGKVYPTAGDAVREQVGGIKGDLGKLKDDLFKLENGDGLPNTTWVRGEFRGDGSISYGTKNRVASEKNMLFSEDTKISVSNGFRFLIAYFSGETVTGTALVLDAITVQANQEFKVNIYRDVEDDTEIADIDVFVSKLICPTKIQKQIDEVQNGVSKVESITMLNKKNLHQMFKKVTVIGDSLSSGFIYDENNNPHSLYEHSWGAIMGGRYNAQYNLACFGGATTKSWWNNEIADRGLDFALSHRAQAYIIALGVNDSGYFEGNIGTRGSIDLNDFNNNGDTFYGWYSKIIQRMSALNNGVVFCLTLPRCIHPAGNEVYNTINIAIRDIVYYLQTNTNINVNLVDLDADYINYYTSPVMERMYYMGHYQVGAYALMANIISEGIDNAIYNNPERFRYAELVETD